LITKCRSFSIEHLLRICLVPTLLLSFQRCFSFQHLLSQRLKENECGGCFKQTRGFNDVFLAFYFMIWLGAAEGTVYIFLYQAIVKGTVIHEAMDSAYYFVSEWCFYVQLLSPIIWLLFSFNAPPIVFLIEQQPKSITWIYKHVQLNFSTMLLNRFVTQNATFPWLACHMFFFPLLTSYLLGPLIWIKYHTVYSWAVVVLHYSATFVGDFPFKTNYMSSHTIIFRIFLNH
jgi:hypothetical protein